MSDAGLEQPDAEQCYNCRFWRQIGEHGSFGHCRRFPPNLERHYPMLSAADWCGEHQSRSSGGRAEKFDRTAYQRDLMRKRRAAARAAHPKVKT